MNNTFNKLIAKGSAIALIASSLVTAMPARAAIDTTEDIMDIMTNGAGDPVQAVGATGVTHTVTFSVDAPLTAPLTLTYPDDGAVSGTGNGFRNFAFVSLACSAGSPTGISGAATADNVYSVTWSGGDCDGDVTAIFTGDNPGTGGGVDNQPGSYPVLIDDGAMAAGAYYAVPITIDDQIQVTATVDPYITFQVTASDTACTSGTDTNPSTHAPTTDGGTVQFGSLSPLEVSTSDSATPAGGAVQNADIEHICTFVSTNAAEGYVLQVSSLEGGLSDGGSQLIPSASGALSAGTEGYGLCFSGSNNTDTNSVGVFEAEAPYNTCAGDNVGAVANAFAPIGGTAGATTPGPVQEDAVTWWLKAAISGTTPAGVYTDTLTFTATGTF